MVRNLFDALRPTGSVRHAALVTGLKHYLGPFEAYGKGSLPQTPFREEQGRLEVDNFYYAQEDELFAAARGRGATLNGRPIRCSEAAELHLALVATGFGYTPERRRRHPAEGGEGALRLASALGRSAAPRSRFSGACLASQGPVPNPDDDGGIVADRG